MVMTSIPFTKMNGCGNDFIIIDNRTRHLQESDLTDFAKAICTQNFAIGADGLLLLTESKGNDFKMRLFNPDGSEGEMCGNGARCIAWFAFAKGVAGKTMTFDTKAGEINAYIIESNQVRLTLPEMIKSQEIHTGNISGQDGSYNYQYSSLFLGVPHCIIFLPEKISTEQLFNIGREIRFNHKHFPNGTNVNFVEIAGNNTISVRTYERGVEKVTLACGTGSASSIVVAASKQLVTSPATVQTLGGNLTIDFLQDATYIKAISLQGPVNVVAQGEYYPSSFNSNLIHLDKDGR